MDLIQEFFRLVYNVPELIRLVGLAGLIFIIFAETGLDGRLLPPRRFAARDGRAVCRARAICRSRGCFRA